MRTVHQITYRARTGSSGMIFETASSLREDGASDLWWGRLEPWLRVGDPKSCAYLNFGTEAAFIRWQAEPASSYDWEVARVLVGKADLLSGRYALELVCSEPSARSADAIGQLIPLLAHALRGERRIAMPWTAPSAPEAVMWGLLDILRMIGDPTPVSFLTHLSSTRHEADLPGLFVVFRPDLAAVLPPDPGFIALATTLAGNYADDPAALRNLLAQHGTREPADHASRTKRLLELLPVINGGAATGAAPSAVSRIRPEQTGQVVRCPMCLHLIDDWSSLEFWRWDPRAEEYLEITIPADLNSLQMERALHGASVRCDSAPGEARIGPHFLPADYGRFGPPVVLGFVGLTRSGKSHLLASMVGAVVERELAKLGVSTSPLDHSLHRRYLDTWVSPLKQGKVLPGTREGIVDFADAFLVKDRSGAERVVALFDVAGGDLAKLDDTTEFLWIADGLFFVIDSARITGQWVDDETFSNVLDVVRKRTRTQPVSAAVVLNKADLLRFDEPVDRWLRSAEALSGRGPDFVEYLRETADVYAFLDRKNALAMAEPIEVCQKATMHVASPTGGAETEDGSVYPRGVTPRRVLRPLVAMLAMTGVLTGPDAEQVGV